MNLFDLQNKYLDLKQCMILGYRGSLAHGTHIPDTDPNSVDDIDLMGVIVPDLSHYFYLNQFGSRGTKEIKDDPWDVVVYEFHKFINLLLKSNPNVISLLWLKDDLYLNKTFEGELLIQNRDLFSSKVAYHSFIEYATAQLSRLQRGVYNGYMGEKRKKMVDKFGFDLKNAVSLVMLLRLGIEFLETGKLTVTRPDAQELKEIKTGKWTLEQVKGESERLMDKIKHAKDISKLPEEPRYEEIEKLCIDIHLSNSNLEFKGF